MTVLPLSNHHQPSEISTRDKKNTMKWGKKENNSLYQYIHFFTKYTEAKHSITRTTTTYIHKYVIF